MSRRTVALAMAAILSYGTTAAGRVETESGYSKGQTYNAALRYLRVDLGYEVTERDPEAGYLLFRYTAPGRSTSTNGSIEIVESRKLVRIFVQLPQMPAYHEQVLSDGLRKKLKDEYGEPPPRAVLPTRSPPTDNRAKRKTDLPPSSRSPAGPGHASGLRWAAGTVCG